MGSRCCTPADVVAGSESSSAGDVAHYGRLNGDSPRCHNNPEWIPDDDSLEAWLRREVSENSEA